MSKAEEYLDEAEKKFAAFPRVPAGELVSTMETREGLLALTRAIREMRTELMRTTTGGNP